MRPNIRVQLYASCAITLLLSFLVLTVDISSTTATTAENDEAMVSFSVMVTNVDGNDFNRGAPTVEIQFGAAGDTAGNDHLLVLV